MQIAIGNIEIEVRIYDTVDHDSFALSDVKTHLVKVTVGCEKTEERKKLSNHIKQRTHNVLR